MADAFLVIDPNNPSPPSTQVAAQIRTLITSGDLEAGAVLPSVRQLARDLGIAPNTIVKAYADLEQDGWIVPRPRKGFSVAPGVGRLAADERSRQLDTAARQLVETARRMSADPQEVRALVDRWLQDATT